MEERDVEEGAIQAEQTLKTLERGDTGDEETRSDINLGDIKLRRPASLELKGM